MFPILDSKLMAMNGRTESYPEMPAIDQRQNFFSHLNSSSIHLLDPQIMAHQALMHQYMLPPFWPAWTPLHYSLSNHLSEAFTSKCDKDELKRSSNSSYSGSDSPTSQMDDSIEIKKFIDKKDSTKSKVFECKFCGKAFGYKHVLQNHEKVHTGEKAYQCTKCNKYFRRDHHLKVHMRQHSGERPFSCDFETCDRKFAQVANLRRHKKTHEHVNLMKIHQKMLTSDEKLISTDLSEDSLEHLTKPQLELSDENIRYQSPVQSEPEDLSIKPCSRNNE